MTWKDAQKNECVMEITDLTAEGDEVMVLQPSDVPFVTTGNGDSDPMAPMRGQTGQIGFISDGGIVLMPGNSHQMRVVLRRGGFTAWTGWVKSETYNQGLWNGSTAATVNVIDDVEALKTWKLDAAGGFGMVTLRELMTECLDHVNGITGGDVLEMEWSVDLFPGVSFEGLFDLQVSRYNFFSRVAESEAHEGMNCHDVMQEVCKTFGWTLSQVPGTPNVADTKMLFSYAGAVNYMRVPYASFRAGEWTGAEDNSPKEIDIEGMFPCGMHQYSLEPGYRKIGVVSKINKASNTLPSLDFQDAAVEWVSESDQFDITYKYGDEDKNEGRAESIPWRVRMLKAQGLVKTNLYENYLDQYGNPVPYSGNVIAEDFDNYRGIHIVSQDFWDGPDAFPGSTPLGEKKRNYAWETVMLYKRHPSSTATVAYLTAESAGSVSFRGGGFVFNAEMHCPLDGDYVGPDVYFKKDGEDYPYGGIPFGTRMVEENGGNYIVCRLRIGEWSWTGERWEKYDTTFRIPLTLQDNYSYARVMDNKTLEMGFNGTGYCIPINETMAGQLVFELVNIERGNGNRIRRAYLKNVSLEYKEAEDENKLAKSEDSHEYTHTEEGWTEDMESRVLSIYSDRDDAANYGVLTYAEGDTVKKLYDNLGKVNRRPEEALLEKMKGHYSRARKMLSVQYKAHDDATPRNVVRIGGVRYNVIMTQRMDWQRCHCEYLLEEA